MNTDTALALSAEAGIGLFGASVAALHALRQDLDPATRYVSEYAVGRHGPLMTAAFGGLGLGSGALTLALARSRARIAGPLELALFGVFSVGISIAGVCRTDLSVPGSDVTVRGRIHNGAALGAFYAIVPAMLMTSLRFKRDRHWHRLQGPATLLALSTAASLIALRYAARPGVSQRAFLMAATAWLALVTHHLRPTSSET